MKRNLKALALALAAVFAMSAIAASGAMAAEEHEFHSEKELTVVKATGGAQVFTISKGKLSFTCKEAHFEGTQATNTADELTVGIKYTGGANGKCDSTSGGENTTIDDSECHYRLDSDTTAGGTTEGEHANVTLTCPSGFLRVTGTLNITVPNQTIEHAVSYVNEGEGTTRDVKVKATAHGIEWVCSNSAFACTLGAGGTSGADGTYTGEVTAQGFVHEGGSTASVPGSYETGAQVGIWVE